MGMTTSGIVDVAVDKKKEKLENPELDMSKEDNVSINKDQYNDLLKTKSEYEKLTVAAGDLQVRYQNLIRLYNALVDSYINTGVRGESNRG